MNQQNLEEQLHILELENKALRFGVEKQTEMLERLQEEVRFLRRFRQLVAKAAGHVEDIPKLKSELSSRKKMGYDEPWVMNGP